MRLIRSSRGFTLLEVLIALFVFSIGILGMAGLQVLSVKTNHSAYMRTQATFLAQSMADRMRANLAGVWASSYTGTYPIAGTPAACNAAPGCTVAQVATRDQILWSQQLSNMLPNPNGTITCTRASLTAVPAADQLNRAPYDGLCTITLTWNEASTQTGTAAAAESFAWVFQP